VRRSSNDLIDHIYEAAFVPEIWDDVLEEIARRSRSATGALFVCSQDMPLRGRSTKDVHEFFERFLSGPNPAEEPCVQRMMGEQPTSFVQVDDFLSPEELQADAGRILLRSLGIGVNACSVVTLPKGAVAMFLFNRWIADGGYDTELLGTLDALRPHLARASLVSERLGLERAQNSVAIMENFGLPAAVLRPGGNVLAVNAQFEALDALFIARAFGGVSIVDRSSNALLQTAIGNMQKPDLPPLVASIPIASQVGLPPHVVHVVPLRRSAKDIFTSADLLLVVTQVGVSTGVPSNAMVTALFDLSPAEARLALRLAIGVSLTEAARDCGLSIASARTYLSRIFSKTGTHSQHQLVALLRSAGSLGS
jgi:DNA-binding CsgD family transcriptional regulator